MEHRVVIISDLHLGADPPMLSQQTALATFIDGLAASAKETLDLVIAGDFIDFLSIPHGGKFAPYSADSASAVARLETALRLEERIVASLAEFLTRERCALVILVGNHDVEMALPETQALLTARLRARPGRNLLFVDDGRAWTCGRLLVEHGNRYDYANLNDWDGIRQIRSARSRGEMPPRVLEPSVGSEFVAWVLSPLKADYPFIDLLQPQGVLVAYLLMALEPPLVKDIDALWGALKANYHAAANRDGNRPILSGNVNSASEEIFGAPSLHAPLALEITGKTPPSFLGKFEAWCELKFFVYAASSEGIASLLNHGLPVPEKSLRNLRSVLAKLASVDRRLVALDSDDPFAKAAARMSTSVDGRPAQFDTVVMGHTHVAREFREEGSTVPYYLNSGSWIDSIEIPEHVLADPAVTPLESWLKRLIDPAEHRGLDQKSSPMEPIRTRDLTFVEVDIAPEGAVRTARLGRWRA